ncbi:MAG: NAD(P)/FAD-dependent oxidoreductase [Phycisphaerales bacterium]
MTAHADGEVDGEADGEAAGDATFDVAVIGAGPAGACAAIAAARVGARVLLVDRSVFPRAKVCGCCLTAAGVAGLRALGAERAVADAAPLATVRLSCGGRSVTLRRAAGVAIGREQLDVRLIEIARAHGVEVRLGVAARVAADGTLALRADADGRAACTVRARTTIVADGLGGTALDGVDGFAWTVAPRSHMGFGAVIGGGCETRGAGAGAVDCAPGEIAMRVARGGYIGAVRLPCGAIDIAAAVEPEVLRAAGSVAACALTLLGDAARDHEAIRAARWRGTPQLTRRRRSIAAPGLLVVGDAAGYVEPFTGEGMTWAISTGSAAGLLAARVSEPHRAWPAMHARLVGGARLRCRAIALALRSPALTRAVVALGNLAPAPLERLAGSIGREGLEPPAGTDRAAARGRREVLG